MFEPLSKTKIECTLLATQVGGPSPPHTLLQGCLYMEDDLPCGRGPLLSQWSSGISPLELPNQPLRSWTPLGLKLCFLDLVPSPFLYPRSRDCWPMLPACARCLPHHSLSPITSQDHHLSPYSAPPMLHLSQSSSVLCNGFCKIILMSPPATSAIVNNLSAIFTLRLFILKSSHWSHLLFCF